MSVYIIAEAGVNHNGSIEMAKQLIDIAADCGANAIKFQTFKAEESTSKFADKPNYQQTTTDGDSQLEVIQRLELPFDDYKILKEYSSCKGIDFISTPDGNESLKCLLNLDVSLIKIGSTEVTNISFLKELGASRKSLILSTGMSTLGEVEKAVDVIIGAGCENLTLMHCTTSYPTDIEDVNIRAMVTMREAFKLPVGFSDHSLTNEAAVAAVTLGATVIEKHITLDKNLPGPDHKASMDPNEFEKYVIAIRNTEKLLGDGIKKPTEKEIEVMRTVRRSILANEDIKAGTVLTEDMLCFKRPGDGIYPEYVDKLVGLVVNRDISKDEKIMWVDVK